ncbi:excinuclease ABC subunit UvrA [Candidatus Laterigemmans baculatus]|uniref:excinuclease ABC subunit UvrA n=1 Tax=Candidatus Laterigemmans baculatus TaxID=2770505 RepID=UPI001F21F210|nr:excinuclease ABC subunit UvrA [Candidatus Laterigemmans baculatus]
MIKTADMASGNGASKSGSSRPENVIRVRGARVHNLRSVDVDLPRDSLTVITGVSGSGKSSLAFDTIYAEGQRQYIESLSAYARQFLDQLERPDVDLVDGLEPTLCIDQKPGTNNPRSTVATVTEIYDYLRLLYARAGTPHCYSCGRAILQQSAEQIVDALAELPEGTKLMLLSPMIRGRRGAHAEVFAEIRKAGLVRARVDGELYPLEEVPALAPRKNHTIEAVVDRVVVREGVQGRMGDSVRLALRFGDGVLTAVYQQPTASGASASGASANEWEERLFSTRYACPDCDVSYEELEPRTFSFNSPYGACEACGGMGRRERFDPEGIVPDPEKSPADGALVAWKGTTAAVRGRVRKAVEPFLEKHGAGWEKPLTALKPAAYRKLFEGDGKFLGLIAMLEEEWEAGRSEKRREQLSGLRADLTCEACGGGRLRREALSVTVAGRAIHETTALPIVDSLEHFEAMQLEGAAAEVAKPIRGEILRRLRFLEHVGVGYLSLDRPADTLSGGELQRVRLATSIGSGLVGVCYVLDEPSIGLHHRDNDRLISAMRDLQQAGNTVLVVEHDEAVMRAADWLVDMGPGAGHRGGTVISQGTPEQVAHDPQSITGRYLTGSAVVPVPQERRPADPARMLVLRGAATHNLKDVELRIPLGLLVGVTGVSGSGKSSLINETLYPAVARRLGLVAAKPGPHRELLGAEGVDKLIRIDQAPIGRSPRSCPATFTGVWDEIRKVFAATREAKQRGYTASRFSFNSAQGRCPQCQGQGQEKIEMNFLSDLYVTCTACGGRRFNRQTLTVRYKHATIADVLNMTVDEAAEFFENFSKIDRFLDSMRAVGLGYLHLGQSSTTLSGGEAQRLKLATELARAETGNTLYLLDEPTTGLHFEDVGRLLGVLQALVDRGNTVIVIEHNLDIAKACDWLVDLGPEGGTGGGRILAEGTPEAVAAVPESPTGKYLQEMLGG